MQEKEEYDYLFKILLIGDSGVGKSSILLRFTEDEFEEDFPCTIGVDFKTKMIDFYNKKKINLTIWDTAGQEKFRSLTSSYYRGTHGIILVYDVTNRASFLSLEHWLKEIDTYSTNSEVIILLIGNKIDMPNRVVTREEGAKFAKSKSMLFMECSAKTKLGIQQAFEELIQKILDTPTLWEENKLNTLTPKENDKNVNNESCTGMICFL
jgi:Ras-related protein Rab-18